MRSTENVRGEWDELGERDTRVIVPGPGTGDVPGPAGTEHGARLPEPGAEPDPVAESTAAVPDTMPVAGDPPAAEDEYIPADLGPALDAVAVVGPAAPVELDLDLGAGPEPGPHGPPPIPNRCRSRSCRGRRVLPRLRSRSR
ncbi:hypothetical protein OVA19_13750 [Streptomyces sp. SL203]|nr:hypothetical protein [Streptomyces sp. SL203]MCY1651711.1 hypothetical protein [Streptomyces sp. SL203]